MPLKTIGWISLKPGSGFRRGIAGVGDRVADLHVGGGLDVGDDVADIARLQFFRGRHLRA